jgi:hypothetical protein
MLFCWCEIKIATQGISCLFPCICVLQPQWIHLFQSSSLLPSFPW